MTNSSGDGMPKVTLIALGLLSAFQIQKSSGAAISRLKIAAKTFISSMVPMGRCLSPGVIVVALFSSPSASVALTFRPCVPHSDIRSAFLGGC